MTDRRSAFTTTVRVIAGVHDRTADGRTDTLVTGLTCLTNLNGIMLDVSDLTDSCLAVETDDSDLTGGQTDLSHAVFLSDKLSENTGGTNELSALTGVKLDVVDHGTDRDVSDRKGVTGLDISIAARVKNGSVGNTDRSYDVALLAGLVLKQSDVCRAVRIVLNSDIGVRSSICGLEVDNAVLDLVSAAAMTNGDLTVAVTTCLALLNAEKAALGGKLC